MKAQLKTKSEVIPDITVSEKKQKLVPLQSPQTSGYLLHGLKSPIAKINNASHMRRRTSVQIDTKKMLTCLHLGAPG